MSTNRRPLSWWIGTIFAIILWCFALYGFYLAGWNAWSVISPPTAVACTSTPYIQVIERNVLRCEPGATLQASADANGYLIAWCEEVSR